MKKPEILKSELHTPATEPQEEAFKAGLEIDELDLEKVTGGDRIGGCIMVDGNGAFAGC